MKRVLTRFLIGVIVVFVALVVVLWSLLALPLFSPQRNALVEKVLTEQVGQEIEITGDVSANLGLVTRITLSGVQIQSENLNDVMLAELASLSLEFDLVDLLRGQINFDDLLIDGLAVNLVTDESGVTSWTKEALQPQKNASQNSTRLPPGIFAFLKDKHVQFTAVSLAVDDRITGFVFDFILTQMMLTQMDDATGMSITSDGTVNEQPFAITGSYPRNEGSETTVALGPINIQFETEPNLPDTTNGFSGQLQVDVSEFGDLFDILLLNRSAEGSGSFSAQVTTEGPTLVVSDIHAIAELPDGKHFEVVGHVNDLLNLAGVDIEIVGRMFAEGAEPPEAETLDEMKFIGIDAKIVSAAAGIKFEQLNLQTNAIDGDLNNIGPIAVGKVFRTEDGALSLEDIRIAVGPEDTPYIHAQGSVLDALQFAHIQIEGALYGPASLIMKDLGQDISDQFGQVRGEFEVSDASGALSLSKFHAQTEGTDIWSLEFQSVTEDLSSLSGVDTDLSLSVPDTKAFMTALGLKPIETGPLSLSMQVQGSASDLSTHVTAQANRSDLRLEMTTRFIAELPIVRGGLFSKKIVMDDIANVIEASVSVASLRKKDDKNSETDDQSKDTKTSATAEMHEDEVKLGEFLDFDQAIADLDLEFDINIAEITGSKGTTNISSRIVSQKGKAKFGPLKMSYAEGFVSFVASMDVLKHPESISVSGETGGWDVGKILDEVGLGVKVHGILKAKFDITSSTDSAKAFMDSMNGSATVSMSRGNIGTSLLEVAGLGAIPWLFSKESQQGYTDIVCVVAPLKITNGSASSNAMVLETKSVQLVVAGNVNWRDDTITLRAEPRPVGRPLARSPFPFEVTGHLTDPQFALHAGAPNLKGLFTKKQKQSERVPCRPDKQQQKTKAQKKKGLFHR